MYFLGEETTCPGQLRCLGQAFFQKSDVVDAYDDNSLNTCIFRNSGTLLRRAKRRRSQKTHVQKLSDSWGQNQTSEILTIALSDCLGLLCVEQNHGNFKHCIFRYDGTPVRRTKRQKKKQTKQTKNKKKHTHTKLHFQKLWDSCTQNKTSGFF